MTTVQRPSAAHHHNKITAARNKVVKPILKKLSHSEKNSLDLDRGWDDQQTAAGFGGLYESSSAGRSARDVSFKFPAFSGGSGGRGASASGGGAISGAALGGGGGGAGSGDVGIAASSTSATASGGAMGGAGRGSTSSDRRKLHHGRSMSGTSGISVASNGSGHRGGSSFVHPFQQTPRTSTPPLSYANSLASFDNNRDYSPTITEHDDDDLDSLSHHIHHHHHHHHGSTHPSSRSQSSLRRPSLASQRTSSLSDITAAAPQLRVNTQRPTQAPTPSSRLLHGGGLLGTSYSHSDLHLNLTSFDSPSSLTGPGLVASPSSSAAPMSPLRSSLDGMGFRLRSRSEVDTVARRDDIREARRKFEEREKIKEEKYDREQIRKQERRENRQAAAQLQPRKHHAASDPVRPTASRKNSPSAIVTTTLSGAQLVGGGAPRKSESSSLRPGAGGRKSSATPDEKGIGFASSNYDAVPGGATPSFGPNVDDVHFKTPKRRATAKKRTQGYWTGFILWLRTRLLRMGRK